MRMGYVRLYNEMPEEEVAAHGGPIQFGFDGKGYVVQPRCGVFREVSTKERTPIEHLGLQIAAIRRRWEKVSDGPNDKNYIDVPAEVAEWALAPANARKTRGWLRTHEQKRSDLEEDIREARSEVEKERAKVRAEREDLMAERAAFMGRMHEEHSKLEAENVRLKSRPPPHTPRGQTPPGTPPAT